MINVFNPKCILVLASEYKNFKYAIMYLLFSF